MGFAKSWKVWVFVGAAIGAGIMGLAAKFLTNSGKRNEPTSNQPIANPNYGGTEEPTTYTDVQPTTSQVMDQPVPDGSALRLQVSSGDNHIAHAKPKQQFDNYKWHELGSTGGKQSLIYQAATDESVEEQMTTSESPRTVNVTKRMGPCEENDTFEGCFWSESSYVNYFSAAEICKRKHSSPAVIEDEVMYEKVMEHLRKKIPKGGVGWDQVWTGINFDPMNGVVTDPEPCYVRWCPPYPRKGARYPSYTNVLIHVDQDPAKDGQGMFNMPPTTSMQGVLCRMVGDSETYDPDPR